MEPMGGAVIFLQTDRMPSLGSVASTAVQHRPNSSNQPTAAVRGLWHQLLQQNGVAVDLTVCGWRGAVGYTKRKKLTGYGVAGSEGPPRISSAPGVHWRWVEESAGGGVSGRRDGGGAPLNHWVLGSSTPGSVAVGGRRGRGWRASRQGRRASRQGMASGVARDGMASGVAG